MDDSLPRILLHGALRAGRRGTMVRNPLLRSRRSELGEAPISGPGAGRKEVGFEGILSPRAALSRSGRAQCSRARMGIRGILQHCSDQITERHPRTTGELPALCVVSMEPHHDQTTDERHPRGRPQHRLLAPCGRIGEAEELLRLPVPHVTLPSTRPSKAVSIQPEEKPQRAEEPENLRALLCPLWSVPRRPHQEAVQDAPTTCTAP